MPKLNSTISKKMQSIFERDIKISLFKIDYEFKMFQHAMIKAANRELEDVVSLVKILFF